MYQLLQGQSLDSLLAYSLQNFSPWWQPGFLSTSRTLVILQNQNVIRWVHTKLAREKGAIGGLDLRIPDQALRGLLDALDWKATGLAQPPLLFMDSLKLLVLHHLESALGQGGPEWEDLQSFIGKSPSTSARLFGLANALSGSLSHYAQNEITIPRAWRAGHPAVSPLHPAASQEGWQKDLWFRCFPAGAGPRLLGSLLDELMDRKMPETHPLTFLPGKGWKRILIMGSPFLSRQAMAFLTELGRQPEMEILHLLLVPGGAETTAPGYPEEPQKGWSRLYTGFRDDMEKYGIVPGDLPPVTPSTGLLGQIQNRLRGHASDFSSYATGFDGSLEFIACTTRARQLEVLKDRLNLLLRDPNLSPQDIAVMAPDLSLFTPFVEDIFEDESTGKLPHNLQDQPAGPDSRLSALKQMISLGSGRLTRKEVIDLCAHPAFAAHYCIEPRDFQAFSAFLEETNTLWGWDESHRMSVVKGYSGSENSWERAKERLALAVAYGSEESLVEGLAGPDIPALAQDQKLAAVIWEFLAELKVTLEEFSQSTLTIGAWCRKIQTLAEDHLGSWNSVEERQDRDELETVLQRLQSQAGELPPQIRDREWSWDLFYQMFLDQAERLDSGPGAFLVRGINFFSFRPLRTLPFKVIALLGMEEGAFPSLDQPGSFDLRNRERTAIDQESTDLFTFLETIMATEQKLMIFWNGRDEVSGEYRPPATPVQDLLDILEETTGKNSEDFILKATVNAHAPVNFHPGEGTLLSTSRRDFAAAKIILQNSGKPGYTPDKGNINLPGFTLNQALTPGRWSLLLSASVRFALQTGSGIYFEEESTPRDTENFALDFFSRREFYHSVLKTLPWLTPQGSGRPKSLSPEETLQHWEIKGAWGNKALGIWEQKELSASAGRLRDQFIRHIPAGSVLKEEELETLPDSLMKGPFTWIETPSGDLVIPYQVESSLESVSKLAFRHRSGSLLGFLGLLSRDPFLQNRNVTVLFYQGSRSQILPWTPENIIFKSTEAAKTFLEDLKTLAEEMVAEPFPLYPQLLEKFLLEDSSELTAEYLEEAWENWSEQFHPSSQNDAPGESVLRSRFDRPGICPYLRCAWRDTPPWEKFLPSMETAAKRFYTPFILPKESKN